MIATFASFCNRLAFLGISTPTSTPASGVKVRDFAYDPSCACETVNTGEWSCKCLMHEIMAFEISLTNQTVVGQAPSKGSVSSESDGGVQVFSKALSHQSLSSESDGGVPVPPSPDLQQQQQARAFPQLMNATVEDADEDGSKNFDYDQGWAEVFASRALGGEVADAPVEDDGDQEYPELLASSSVDGDSESVSLESTQDDTGSSGEESSSSSEKSSSLSEEGRSSSEEDSSDEQGSSDEEIGPDSDLEPLLGWERPFGVGFDQQATDSAPEPIPGWERPFGVGLNQCDIYRGKLFFDDDEQEDDPEQHDPAPSTPSLTPDNGTESSGSSEDSYDSNGDRVVYLTMPARGTIAQRRLAARGYDVEMMERQQSYFFTYGRLRTSDNMDPANIFRPVDWNGRASVGVPVSWGPSIESTMRAQSTRAAAVEGPDEQVYAPVNWPIVQHRTNERDAGDELLGFPFLPSAPQLRRIAADWSGEVLAFGGEDVSFGGMVEYV